MKGKMMNKGQSKKIRSFINRFNSKKEQPRGQAGLKPCSNPFLLRSQKARVANLAAFAGISFYLSSLMFPSNLMALPQDGKVVAGAANIVKSSATRLDINQATNKAVIDWRSFNINVNEHTNFNQPSASSITLNRVKSADPSNILGALTANGRVVLVNPNGVFFGRTATVDVAGLVATTANIRNEDFLAGKFNFNIASQNPNASVINQGNITIKDAGLAALVAPVVANSGVIQAKLGKVVLASGNTFTLDFYGDQLVQFDVGSTLSEDQGLMADALVSNSGLISADGGTVWLTASAAGRALNNVINMDGIVDAKPVSNIEPFTVVLIGAAIGPALPAKPLLWFQLTG